MHGYEARQVFAEHLELGDAVVTRFRDVRVEIDTRVAAIREELQQALTELAVAYLPTLDAEALARAEQLTGFRGFSRRDPRKAMEHEAHVLRTTIARIVADPQYQRREYLVGPNGEYTRELAEREGMLATWQSECDRFESLDGFMDLLQVQYDTPHFTGRWYQASYWSHWARGDAICEALGLGDFGDDVLPAYGKVAGPRDDWRLQVVEAQRRVDAVHALVQEHDDAIARIPQLPELYLGQCQQVLAEFLGHADPLLLMDWLTTGGGDRAVEMALKRTSGLRAKIDVLEEISSKGISAALDAVAARATKHRRKLAKYGRAKHQYASVSERDLDPSYRPKMQKLLADADKLLAQTDRIHRFDRYDRFEMDQEPELWFLLFNGDRAPTRYSPGLRAWYERNPGTRVRTVDDDTATAAVVGRAASSVDRHDAGYLS